MGRNVGSSLYTEGKLGVKGGGGEGGRTLAGEAGGERG